MAIREIRYVLATLALALLSSTLAQAQTVSAIGSAQVDASPGNVLVITTTQAVPAGGSIVVAMTIPSGGLVGSVNCNDNSGQNQYVTDVAVSGGIDFTGICSTTNIASIRPAGSTIFVQFQGIPPNFPTIKRAQAFSASGLIASVGADRTNFTTTSSTSASVTLPAATSQAQELLFAVVSDSGQNAATSGFAPGSNGTANTCTTSGTTSYTSVGGVGTNAPALFSMYCYVSASATYSANATFTFATSHPFVLASYRAVFPATITMLSSCPSGSNWSNPACWSLGRAPISGDDVVIAGSAPAATTYDLGAGVQLHSLTISGAAGAVTVSGGPIAFQTGATITDSFANNGTDTLPGITLNGPATFAVTPPGETLQILGVVTGASGLTKTGTGTLTLAGTNTYTGATTVSGGALRVTGSTASGTTITVANAAALGGTGAINGNVVLSAGSTLDTSSGLTVQGTVTNNGGAITKLNQTITFGAIGAKVFGDIPFTVSATAGSTLAVTFSSLTTGVCTVAVNTVTIVAVGTCTIAADQAGNLNYNAAPQVTQGFNVKANQAITFGALGAKVFGDIPFTVSATGGASGNAVTFSSTTTAVCTVSTATVTIVGAGTCTIAADQAGNTNYNAAPQMAQSFTVAKANQAITFPAILGHILGDAPFGISATSSSSLTVTFSSATPAVCSVSGAQVTLLTGGTCTIDAIQAGNANYNATQAQRSFTTSVLPRLANISTRGQVLTGNDVMIAGFIVQGDGSQRVVVNVAGPSLVPFGITNALMNPKLTIVRSSDQTTIATNDDWQTQTNPADVAAIQAAGFQPNNPAEPAVILTLPPGAYTAIVEGVGGTTGVALVGVFAAP